MVKGIFMYSENFETQKGMFLKPTKAIKGEKEDELMKTKKKKSKID